MDENPDDIIGDAREYIATHGVYRYGRPIQKLMDLVSGVHHYNMTPGNDQGFIYRKLIRNMEHNHIVDMGMMVSKFWYGAIQAILRAQPLGTEVDVRYEHERRNTNMSPLQYIRNHGVAAARKYVDECCRKRLKQLCHDCSSVTNLGKQRELDPGCRCGHKESKLRHMFIKFPIRVCLECGVKRGTVFERVCGILHTDKNTGEQWVTMGCGSSNIELIQVEDFVDNVGTDAWEWKFGITDNTPESDAVDNEKIKDAERFAKDCISALPPDTAQADGESQSRKILRILIDPVLGADICKKCKENDDDSCGAQIFDIGSCVNYSRKLGNYFGYSTALANRRVKKIRLHTINFAQHNKHRYITAKYVIEKIMNAETPARK